MTAAICNDDLYSTLSFRKVQTDLETSCFGFEGLNAPSADIDAASQPIVLEHFRLGTWIGAALTGVRHLDKGWDGYGAPKIDWRVIRKMSRALSDLQPAYAYRAGAIVPGADGSLQAEWHLEGVSIEFCIEADLSESLWVKNRATGEVLEAEGELALTEFQRLFGTLRL
jgi:hypothetical protein